MSDQGAYGERIAERFRLEAPPPLVVKNLTKVGFAATRLVAAAGHGMTLPIPREDAFLVMLQLRDFPSHELWLGGKPLKTDPYRKGTFSVVNLELEPSAHLTAALDCLHFYMPRAAIERIAEESYATRMDGFQCHPGVAHEDAVVRHLGLALLPALERPHEVNQVFVDHVASAMHLHMARAHGSLREPAPSERGLARWQLRRALELLSANLAGDVSLSSVAAACNLSLSHFTRAFRRSTGVPPHRWLLARRVEVARVMLHDTDQPLAEIAGACGFADQSHFTRVFRQHVGVSPGAWRRRK